MNPQQRRDLYLQEMGLGQRWLLRSRGGQGVSGTEPNTGESINAKVDAEVGAEVDVVAATADWMLVGAAEHAGSSPDGDAFPGPAGKLLDAMLAAIDLQRHQNVRLAACNHLINKEILQGGSRLVLAMGESAAQTLLATDAGIDSLRGRVHRYQELALIVTYHPADLLRMPADKAKAWEDLLLARRTMLGLLR